MTDYLIVIGAALLVLSVPVAIIALARTYPPRGAAILFVAGVLMLAVAVWQGAPVSWQTVPDAWARITGNAPAPVAPEAEAPVETETEAPATN
ncbi:MAG: hypothetical protein Q4G36_06325 [Paracoccus sp. (in: a-proteobacteria)]|nr:hypothetical protein [Paracoccus sp. (in: a-proteobacteria)]